MPNWAQNGPKWSKTCYIDHLGSFWALLDRFGTSASLPCSAIFGPKRAIMIRGSQKGGVGGGSDVWEKFPNNIAFFVWQRTLVKLFLRANWHFPTPKPRQGWKMSQVKLVLGKNHLFSMFDIFQLRHQDKLRARIEGRRRHSRQAAGWSGPVSRWPLDFVGKMDWIFATSTWASDFMRPLALTMRLA